MTGQWWRIVAPHFVAGLRVCEGLVVEAAPILRWTLRRSWVDVRAKLIAKGWHDELLGGTP